MAMMRAGGEIASQQQRCRWHRCRGPLKAERASRRFCSGRCRMASHRSGRYAARLRACTVEPIGRREGRAFILQHELLGTVGNAVIFFGLRDPRASSGLSSGSVMARTPRAPTSCSSAARLGGGRRTMPRRS
jgi:hypothetical protein